MYIGIFKETFNFGKFLNKPFYRFSKIVKTLLVNKY